MTKWPNDSRLQPIVAGLSGGLGVVAAAITVAITSGSNWMREFMLVVAVVLFAVAYPLAVWWAVRYVRRARKFDLRIAVTGKPDAGKTVFSMILFDALTNDRRPGISFSAESRALIAVYQAIRNIPKEKWPARTSEGSVSIYSGRVEAGRRVIDIEIGDTAGEYWLDLSEESSRDAGYVEYVVSAHLIAHVIDCGRLRNDVDLSAIASDLDDDVSDLLLAARLGRAAGGARAVDGRLLLVLAKLDLLIEPNDLRGIADLLLTPLSEDGMLAALTGLVDSQILSQISRAASRMRNEFHSIEYLLSTVSVVVPRGVANLARSGELLEWVVSIAVPAG